MNPFRRLAAALLLAVTTGLSVPAFAQPAAIAVDREACIKSGSAATPEAAIAACTRLLEALGPGDADSGIACRKDGFDIGRVFYGGHTSGPRLVTIARNRLRRHGRADRLRAVTGHRAPAPKKFGPECELDHTHPGSGPRMLLRFGRTRGK
jgi:hypothetical protein